MSTEIDILLAAELVYPGSVDAERLRGVRSITDEVLADALLDHRNREYDDPMPVLDAVADEHEAIVNDVADRVVELQSHFFEHPAPVRQAFAQSTCTDEEAG